jgi:tetratricopeptide (TPR) repeat protein
LPVADDARVVVQQLLSAFARGAKPEEIRKLFSRDMVLSDSEDELGPTSDAAAFEALKNRLRIDGLSAAVSMDLVASNVQYQVEGNDKAGWRVKTRMPGSGAASMLMFVTREDGRFVIAATESSAQSIGSNVLRLADAGDLESARMWLNWTREEMSAAGGDDPLAGMPFPMYWAKAKQNATLDEIRTAAALLMIPKKAAERSLPILLEARGKAQTDAAKTAIDEALRGIYGLQEKWESALPIAERLLAAYPDSPSAFSSYATMLALNGRKKEAEALVAKRLERIPRDADALRALSNVATISRDYATAQKLAQQLIDENDPSRNDFNHAAWLALFTGDNHEVAVTHAQQASAGEPSPFLAASMHTLAALYAETGKSMEARAALLKSMEMRDHLEPDRDDWYVLGRIAENFGARDTALAAYKKVTKASTPGASSWELAEKRLSVLAGGKK